MIRYCCCECNVNQVVFLAVDLQCDHNSRCLQELFVGEYKVLTNPVELHSKLDAEWPKCLQTYGVIRNGENYNIIL